MENLQSGQRGAVELSKNGQMPSGSFETSRDGISIADMLGVLRRSKRWVIGGAVIGLGVAAAVVFLQPPEYQATAVVRLTDPRKSIVQGLEETPDRDQSQKISALQSEIQLLRSRPVVVAAVDSEGLRVRQLSPRKPRLGLTAVRTAPDAPNDTLELTFSATSLSIESHSGGAKVDAAYGDTVRVRGVSFVLPARPILGRATLVVAPRDQIRDWLLLNLKVQPRIETDVVDVSFTHGNAAVATSVVNQLVTGFRDASIRAAQSSSRRRREFLQEQLQEIGTQLSNSERALADFRSRQHAYSSRVQIEAQQTALMSLDMRREELDADKRMYQALLTRMEAVPADSGDMRSILSAQELSSNPAISQIYERLAQYENARDSLTTGEWRSAATNPDVVRLNTLIKSVHERLIGAVRGHIETLNARLTALNELRSRSADSISTMPMTETAETQLMRQVETNRAMDTHFREEFQKARMAEEVEAGRVEVVDLASVPYKPVPNLAGLKLALGLFAGVLGGGGTVLARERLGGSIRRRRELEDHVGVTALAIIPNMGAEVQTRRRFPLSTLGRRNGQKATPAGLSVAGSEAYRLLHANLSWLQGTQQLKTIVVVSALPSEGKTTVAANLALTFALEGRRTLLIDADLRRPRVHRTFRVARAPGVAQCLAGIADTADAIRTTFIDGLYVLPAGHADSTPGLVLRAGPMRKLIADCADRFEVIIIDTPPIFVAADAAVIGPLADGVLFVVRAGSTESEAAHQAYRQISSVGAHVIGAVLNDPNGESGQYGEQYASYLYADSYAARIDESRK